MKIVSIKTLFFFLLAVGLLACKKNKDLIYQKDFASFILPAAVNDGLQEDIAATISENEITLKIPNSADITRLVPAFELTNPRTIIKAGGVVQESGVSALDFTSPVQYVVKAEDRTTKTYTVKVVRNAGITKFGFYAADNPGVLFKDYEAVIRALDVKVNLPVGTDLKRLVARFEASPGASVKVAGVDQQSGVTAHDYSTPVEYEVIESGNPDPDKFVVTVGFLTNPEWMMIAPEGFVPVQTYGLKLAINPVTNMPLLAYQRRGVGEDGISIPTADRKVAAIAYDGTTWNYVGSQTGFSEGRGENVTVAFDKAGVPYVGYNDFITTDQKITVQKFSNGGWSSLGLPRFSIARGEYISLAIDGNNTPFVSMTDRNGTAAGIARGVYVITFNGSDWVTANFASGTPAFFTRMRERNGKVYLGIMDRSTGGNKPSLFGYQNNTWSAVGPTSFSANGMFGFQGVAFDVAPDGTAYLVYQESPSGGRINHVMKFNGSTWEELGTPDLVGSERDNFALAVHPNGTLFYAFVDASGLFVKTFNKNTNNWNPTHKLITGDVTEFDLQISKDGIPYLAASLGSNDKTVVYKYDIP